MGTGPRQSVPGRTSEPARARLALLRYVVLLSEGQIDDRCAHQGRRRARPDESAHRARYDLDVGGRGAERLTINLNRDSWPAGDEQLADLEVGHLRVVFVPADDHQKQVSQLGQQRLSREDADVEQSV